MKTPSICRTVYIIFLRKDTFLATEVWASIFHINVRVQLGQMQIRRHLTMLHCRDRLGWTCRTKCMGCRKMGCAMVYPKKWGYPSFRQTHIGSKPLCNRTWRSGDIDVHLAELDKLTLQPPLDLFFGSLSPTLAMYPIFHGHTGVTEKGISNDTQKLAV